METKLEPPIIVETGPQPTAAVIWLHGLGADGHDFEPLVPELKLPRSSPVRFVFPHAPYRAVTWNNGYVMRAWYDIAWDQKGFHQDQQQLQEAQAMAHGWIDEQRNAGIAPSRIVLAGFSQGGVVALHAGLHYPETLAGIVCLSAPVIHINELGDSVAAANVATPIFIAHGEYDDVVPMPVGLRTYERLRAAGLEPVWHRYPMAHGVCPEEVEHISSWLQRRFEPVPAVRQA